MKYYIKIEHEYLYNPHAYLNPQHDMKYTWSECWTSFPSNYRQVYYASLKDIRKTKICIQHHLNVNKIPKIYIKK